jgi:gluconate 5-dehydrogenase
MSHEQPTVSELFDLRGKVAMVTGASGHLGAAMANALAEAGATLIVTSRDAARARAVAQRLTEVNQAEHYHIQLDHMGRAAVDHAFHSALTQAGKIDILVNNAHESLQDDLTTITAEQFNRQLANATGYFLLARQLHDHLVSRHAPGSIVMVGSMYGLVASYPDAYAGIAAANSVAYQCLKGGIIQMTRHLAAYWAMDRVRVNCLSPGPFPAAPENSELVQRLAAKVPLGRIGRPYELKGAVVFLASDASSYVTGQNLIVDGGWTIW